MSLSTRYDLSDVERLADRINQLGSADTTDLMDAIAFEGENQTRRRIRDEKTAPDGTAWPSWSPDYAATRNGGQGLLEGQGDLVDSMVSDSSRDHAEWGSNLVYFAIHNFGGTPDMKPGPAAIPQREMLGLSDENEDDIGGIVDDWAERQVADL